jgi:hypothetical protein
MATSLVPFIVVEKDLHHFLQVRKHVSSALLEVQAAHAEREEDKEAVKRDGWTVNARSTLRPER